MNELRGKYDIIILDCPPTIAVTDASLIAKISDGVIFVIAYNHTKKDLIKESLETLHTVPAYVTFDNEKLEGTYVRLPERSELSCEIDESLIVEYYNRLG